MRFLLCGRLFSIRFTLFQAFYHFFRREADGSFIRPSQHELLGDTKQTARNRRRPGQKMEAKDCNKAQLADKRV